MPLHGKCEAITVPLCLDMPYNETIFPNLLNQQSQEDAGLELHQFFPLVKVKCSKELNFFLCAFYVPVCTVLEDAIPPCMDLCVEARSGCETLMNKFGFVWPENMDCDKFPKAGLCIGGNKTESSGNVELTDTTPVEQITTQSYGQYFLRSTVINCQPKQFGIVYRDW